MKKGFAIAGGFACKKWDTWGPFRLIGGINKARTDEPDLKSAREFAKVVVEGCRSGSYLTVCIPSDTVTKSDKGEEAVRYALISLDGRSRIPLFPSAV